MIIINYIEEKHKTSTTIAGLINEEFDIINDSLMLKNLIQEYRDRFYNSILYELYVIRDAETKDFQLIAFLEKDINKEYENRYKATPLPKQEKPKSKYLGEYGKRLEWLKKNKMWNPPKKEDKKEK